MEDGTLLEAIADHSGAINSRSGPHRQDRLFRLDLRMYNGYFRQTETHLGFALSLNLFNIPAPRFVASPDLSPDLRGRPQTNLLRHSAAALTADAKIHST